MKLRSRRPSTEGEVDATGIRTDSATPKRGSTHLLLARFGGFRGLTCLASLLLLSGCSASDDDTVAVLEERLARLQQIADESSTTSTEVATTSTTEPTPETSTTSTTSTTATSAPPTQETVPEPEQADPSTAPTLPDTVLSLPKEFDQFRFSYESVDLLPDLPTTLEGFDPFDGEDVHGREGLVRKDEVRLFEGDSAFTLPYGFASQINRCGDRYWVLRWVSFNPNVLIVASNAIDPYFSENYNPDLSLLPPPATAGIMGNTICYAPGFRFHSAPSSLATLVDVAFEWTYYDRDPFARSG